MSEAVHGYVAFVLHAHIPYVRQTEEHVTLEERWFFEAVVDSYLPLIDMLDRLLKDGIRFRLTLSLSPPLLAMLADPLLQQRLRKQLASLRELAQREVFRLWGDPEFAPTAIHYADRYRRLAELYDRLGGDLIGNFRSLRDTGCVELITCAATHAFLPLVKNDAALRAQLEAAVVEFRRHFGADPAGIWLPECGYTPAVEPHLQALGLRHFVVDAHAHAQAMTTPQAKARAGAPLRTRGGACAFARDPEAGAQVWSAASGYPSDADYREYYRDIGFDLGHEDPAEWDYIKPYVLPDGQRIHTGLKYHRVTGPAAGGAKAPYHPARAAHKAQHHAEHFIAARVAQLRSLAREGEAQSAAAGTPRPAEPPVIVCPYDAELFGHWWYEGPQWLEAVLRGLDAARSDNPDVVVSTTTLGAYAAAHAPTTEAELPVSSWGRGGYAEVWLQPHSQWVHPQLHAAEDRMLRIARKHPDPSALTSLQQRALNQAARELMLAQSSDWTFILDAGTVTDYASRRIRTHLEQLHLLLDGFEDIPSIHTEGTFPDLLKRLEQQTPFLPLLSYQLFNHFDESVQLAVTRSDRFSYLDSMTVLRYATSLAASGMPLRILMLAWEYPPRIIGGLARAVCDLSKQLAASGHTVHVITCHAPDCPEYELSEGVHVHRVQVLQSIQPIGFLDWVFQMNLAFTDTIQRLSQQNVTFHVIHAHDWLVYYAAKESKQLLGLPLVATIHATEFGRNQGKPESDIGQRIHHLEAKLTTEADRVIACSQFMLEEVLQLFALPADKVSRIPNGVLPYRKPEPYVQTVNPLLSTALQDAGVEDRIICFLGRLVHEKGVHLLISAMRLVLKRFPQAKLIIAGTGPAQESLQMLAAGLGNRVYFTGFLDDSDKQLLLDAAELCVIPSLYEPFGLVALEAMASRTPLIVSDVGGLAEIIANGIDGRRVPAGDVSALAWEIAACLEQPELALRLADAALAKIRTTYDWQEIGTSTAEVYYRLVFDLRQVQVYSSKTGKY
ncbi:1,4-alpha-glucan branching protein domain-containing protein [Paenibacillus sedimenti]|uniref:DUF1957 domain-containing protein n=1 Tax=Paenibacillus sedimenti TaxID=2770274 RepID=A0A926KPQ8_9BACL|nr:1,4-alpha-glucan branching protein domain-containing protein [Paenibacillus sedimenti]MBD0379865.1 DUF1957 domain-containing protein [Paenibacillus sedimenti]